MAAVSEQAVEELLASLRADVSPKYSATSFLGAGAQGMVFAAVEVESNRPVAIKRIAKTSLNHGDLVRLLREVLLMKHLHHVNVISLHEMFAVKDTVYLVIDAMESDLHRIITSDQALTERHIKYFIFQLLAALDHLHSAGVCHRDVKPSNVLVNKNCKLKLGDLGMSRELIQPDDGLAFRTDRGMTEYVCTRWYRAPELLMQERGYTAAIDVWSAGCVAAELVLKTVLFPGKNYIDQLEKILDVLGLPSDLNILATPEAWSFVASYRPQNPRPLAPLLKSVGCPDDLVDLLAQMLVFNPSQRITARKAMEHPTLAEFFSKLPPAPPVERFFMAPVPEGEAEMRKLIDRCCTPRVLVRRQ